MLDKKAPAGLFRSKPIVAQLKNQLRQTFGDTLVLYYNNEQVYLNHAAIQQKKLNASEVQQYVANYFLTVEGVANALTATDLNRTTFSHAPHRLLQKGYYPKRSGDVLVVLEPGWMEHGQTGTTHGSSYSYDTHIPLLWFGWHITKGSTAKPVMIEDIAPTISTLLNIPFPNGCVGKPIFE